MRLLDVGCGWGGMLLHAARHHGVTGVGITLAEEQATLARTRIAEAGLDDRLEVRVQDYRDIDDGPFDAISSIGMVEHVGDAQLDTYAARLCALLRPGGRLLNHGITTPPHLAGPLDPHGFMQRYIFPDGELQDVGRVIGALQGAGRRCATARTSGSTTPSPCEPGCTTSRSTGTTPWPRWARPEPGCGACTSPVA